MDSGGCRTRHWIWRMTGAHGFDQLLLLLVLLELLMLLELLVLFELLVLLELLS